MSSPKTAEIEIAGKNLLLSVRKAGDVLNLYEYSCKIIDRDLSDVFIENLIIIGDALKINLEKLKWYQWIKRIKTKRLISKENLLKKLTSSGMTELVKKVYELEGIDLKKKTESQESELAEVSQNH